MIKIIAAVAVNGVIGNNDDLVLTHKEDFKRFKRLTTGHTVVMGRKTWESLPIKPLPNRENIVVSRNGNKVKAQSYYDDETHFIGDTFDDLKSLLLHLDEFKRDENHHIFIIGGGEIYKQTIHLADELLLTKWITPAEGNIYFPEDSTFAHIFQLISWELPVDPDAPFTFDTYTRR